jgi:hypothetical protein
MGAYLMGVHLMGIHFIGMHLIRLRWWRCRSSASYRFRGEWVDFRAVGDIIPHRKLGTWPYYSRYRYFVRAVPHSPSELWVG